jgi:transcriptional regulator with XRE-family HTH domain
MHKQTLARLVHDAREAKGWTQEGMAEITGISRSTIANIEAGTTQLPKAKHLEALERHLGLSQQEMLRAAGRLDTPEGDVLAAMERIDRLPTEAERLAEFRALPESVRRAIRKLASDFLSAATQELMAQDEPHEDRS